MYRMILFVSLLAVALGYQSPIATAQTQLTTTPNASPQASVGQTIGLTEVFITYHRPAVQERAIWGELVPYGAVWRAGANDNTTIRFSNDVMIEGQPLAAGTYGLHMIPGKEEWAVIFSNNSTAWGSYSYKEGEDALRVRVKPKTNSHSTEYLTYSFEPKGPESASCKLEWADKSIAFGIAVSLHEDVVGNFRKELQHKAGWSWQGWHEAAAYCLRNETNYDEALAWASRSVFMNPNPNNMAVKAQLAGKTKASGDDQKELMVALETMEKDLAAAPCTWREYNGAATFAVQREQYDKAQAWSEKAMTMSPNMTTMMAHAKILEANGKKKEAEGLKKKAIAQGSNAELNTYGYQLLFSGKVQEALEVFRANTEKNPKDPNVWDSLGEGYVFAGEKEKAVEALTRSLSLNPPDNVRANSMKLLAQLGVDYESPKP